MDDAHTNRWRGRGRGREGGTISRIVVMRQSREDRRPRTEERQRTLHMDLITSKIALTGKQEGIQ